MANLINGTVEVDPISRIEGHLGVKLTTDENGLVSEANVHGNLWRGFENFLIGRNPNDAITFVQRICGVCPVPHATAAMFAVESVYGYNDNFQTGMIGTYPVGSGKGVPAKALHIRNLVLSAEFLMSSITHFYHLAAPSYVQGPNMAPWTPYFDTSYYDPLLLSAGHGIQDGNGKGILPLDDRGFSADLWSAVIKQYVKALRIRRLTFEAGAMFAGRMPMTSSFVAGGVTTDNTENLTAKCQKFRDMIAEVGTFIVKEYVPLVLALGALYAPFDNTHNGGTGAGYGAGIKKYLSWGAFPQSDGSLALHNGFKGDFDANTGADPISSSQVLANLREDVKFSRYETGTDRATAAGYVSGHITDPSKVSRTIPLRTDPAKYSWLKAPRWSGQSCEVGPLARMHVMRLFKDGIALATSCDLTPFGLADYADYTYSGGLDPKMVSADLAVALLRSGLAELYVSPGTVVGKTVGGSVTISITDVTLDYAAIKAAYETPGAYITGAVAGWIIGLKGGASTMDRLRARAIESLYLVQKMLGAFNKANGSFPGLDNPLDGWIGELKNVAPGGATYAPKPVPVGSPPTGFGATEAPRGALMHFLTVKGGKIDAYQCVVPTTWNASPKASTDGAGNLRGPMEEAMIGIPYSLAGAKFTSIKDGETPTAGGVEALRVAQSFDPCIACAVH